MFKVNGHMVKKYEEVIINEELLDEGMEFEKVIAT